MNKQTTPLQAQGAGQGPFSMGNILNSKIVVTGARSHWTGNRNGEVVSPKVEIYGLLENGQPYGAITAEVAGSTTDGGAYTSLWSVIIPFGLYKGYRHDKVVVSNGVATVTVAEIPAGWTVYTSKPRVAFSVSEEKALAAAGLVPMQYYIRFVDFPTLEEINEQWSRLLELGCKYLTVKDGVVYIETAENKKIPFYGSK